MIGIKKWRTNIIINVFFKLNIQDNIKIKK